MSYILTEELARLAVQSVRPMFRSYFSAGLVKRDDLWIVVMDPTKPYDSVRHFQFSILGEYKFGNPGDKYKDVARSKARVSWRTGLPSHLVQQNAPFLLLKGDTKWGGSTVTPEGLVVACSGVEWYMDQHMSEVIASAIKALCIHEMQEIMKTDVAFLGG
jgi:hypothetical protein